ncbi:MAG: hypothetical protein CO186_10465 [Zetaproteobacteria bacterium CG_4_9_14_3_um_filter_49_83]|nr:MAG: hypothetical protein AUJ56_11950 [Zetaproteobacteria bacterium CG1_02_49_23]PIQ31887.1 MAG: hypothetical protein COW62_08700 [Zetaproteobacteria bacterium CG17_big_fil_post_rev_8_21_14_2_50_50_13]PIV30454.1 MAG: hypothetical protein COS35_06685 [Zetaproteobacteria bacterium CG02_land_8_20_14_3_00_50_9]PIY55420.1 MAG: hypothetical protein COZ00_09580 [Zetaproteobacteria bacterium CG_4_10_14_0_8_um_filter_49_80]PJA34565.1 MAG: hypothetical protein CO186_10465 [Zetaproteobacteria bacterium
MPVLHIQTNIAIGNTETLLKDASAMVAKALGKPENYVMVQLSGDHSMSFAGTTEPLAYVELKSLGLSESQTQSLSSTICTWIQSNLDIQTSRIYIEFSAPSCSMFGWNGGTF